MKTTRYIFTLLVLALASVLPAQVINLYQYGYRDKLHVNDFDSIVVAPAVDYSINYTIGEYYIDLKNRMHGRISVEIGPDATTATADMYEAYYSDSIRAHRTLTPGTTNELDFIIPVENADYKIRIATSSPYGDTYETTATLRYRVDKWRSLGMGTFQENFWWEESSECEIFINDACTNEFKLVNPFDNMPYIDDYLTGRQTKELTFRILQWGESFGGTDYVRTEGLVYFEPINTGYYHSSYGADVMMYHPSKFSQYDEEKYWQYNKVLSWQDDYHSLPGQVQLAPRYYMDGVGGWDQTQDDNIVIITFPGARGPLYEANIENDFSWNEVFTGDFTSAQLGTNEEKTLYKGSCINNTDDCGTRFAEEHGEVYTIASPYTEDYNIYFCVKDGRISIPEGYEYQRTGLNAVGTDVYAYISATRSSLEDNCLKLYIIFSNYDGSKVYGEATETLQNVSWTTVGTVDYTYTIVFSDYDEETGDESPYTDAGLELQQNDSNPTEFRVLHWGYDTEFYFTWDQQTNKMTVPVGATGYEYGTYGMVYVADIPNYYGAFGASATYDDYPCTYDPETQTASLTVAYFVSTGGSFGNGVETMKINLGATRSAAPLKAKAKRPIKPVLKNKRLVKPITERISKFGKPVAAELAKPAKAQAKAQATTERQQLPSGKKAQPLRMMTDETAIKE